MRRMRADTESFLEAIPSVLPTDSTHRIRKFSPHTSGNSALSTPRASRALQTAQVPRRAPSRPSASIRLPLECVIRRQNPPALPLVLPARSAALRLRIARPFASPSTSPRLACARSGPLGSLRGALRRRFSRAPPLRESAAFNGGDARFARTGPCPRGKRRAGLARTPTGRHGACTRWPGRILPGHGPSPPTPPRSAFT